MDQQLIRSQEERRPADEMQSPPVDLRVAVVLRFYQDLPFDEIAEIMDADESAVMMRVYHGLERLRGAMKNEKQESRP